jgi:hypothetical protein
MAIGRSGTGGLYAACLGDQRSKFLDWEGYENQTGEALLTLGLRNFSIETTSPILHRPTSQRKWLQIPRSRAPHHEKKDTAYFRYSLARSALAPLQDRMSESASIQSRARPCPDGFTVLAQRANRPNRPPRHSGAKAIFRPHHFQLPTLLRSQSPVEVQLVFARLWIRGRTARSGRSQRNAVDRPDRRREDW